MYTHSHRDLGLQQLLLINLVCYPSTLVTGTLSCSPKGEPAYPHYHCCPLPAANTLGAMSLGQRLNTSYGIVKETRDLPGK